MAEEQTEDDIAYEAAEKSIRPEDYIGNVLFCPDHPDDKYFSYIWHRDCIQVVLNQLNSEFDIRRSLTKANRLMTIEIKYTATSDPIPTRVFARLVKGVSPDYLAAQLEEWNEDMRCLDPGDRLSLYETMVVTSKEKFVHGFDIVRCKAPGGKWIRKVNLNPVQYSKRQRDIAYPKSTTDEDAPKTQEQPVDTTALDYEYSSAVPAIGNETLDLLVPDISIRTKTSSTSSIATIEQSSSSTRTPSREPTPSQRQSQAECQHEVQEQTGEQPEGNVQSRDQTSYSQDPGEGIVQEQDTAHTSSQTPRSGSASTEQPAEQQSQGGETGEEMDVEQGSHESDDAPMEDEPHEEALQEEAEDPLAFVSVEPEDTAVPGPSSGHGAPLAKSTPIDTSADSSRDKRSSSKESTILSGTEFGSIVEAHQRLRDERRQRKLEQPLSTDQLPSLKRQEDAVRRMQQAAGDEFQQAVAEALTESMKTQAQLFRYVNEMVANENMRGERDQAMENALKKITKNTGKRERSVTAIKKNLEEAVEKLDDLEHRAGKAGPSREKSKSPHHKGKRTAYRQAAIEDLAKLLRIEVFNASSVRLLSAPAYKCYMAEKIMTKIVSKTTDNIASNFNNVFFQTQFSRRCIANLYYGDDSRASNINWASIPLPEPSRELWEELAQVVTGDQLQLTEKLQDSRRSMLNDAKRKRNAAFRKSVLNNRDAEKRLYDDKLEFFNMNKDYKKETRPSDKPPGFEVHYTHVKDMKGVRNMYAHNEKDVEENPRRLQPNHGYICTEEAVDNCITALENEGYGQQQTPAGIMLSKQDVILPAFKEQAAEKSRARKEARKKRQQLKKAAQAAKSQRLRKKPGQQQESGEEDESSESPPKKRRKTGNLEESDDSGSNSDGGPPPPKKQKKKTARPSEPELFSDPHRVKGKHSKGEKGKKLVKGDKHGRAKQKTSKEEGQPSTSREFHGFRRPQEVKKSKKRVSFKDPLEHETSKDKQSHRVVLEKTVLRDTTIEDSGSEESTYSSGSDQTDTTVSDSDAEVHSSDEDSSTTESED